MLTWNVYISDFNRREIITYNVFRHAAFSEACRNALRLAGDDPSEAERGIRFALRYYFWSKCEWEIVLSGWPESSNHQKEKVDVADQIEINWDRFFEYIWAHRDEFDKTKN